MHGKIYALDNGAVPNHNGSLIHPRAREQRVEARVPAYKAREAANRAQRRKRKTRRTPPAEETEDGKGDLDLDGIGRPS